LDIKNFNPVFLFRQVKLPEREMVYGWRDIAGYAVCLPGFCL